MTTKPKLKANQRLTEFPNEGFAVLDGNLYCNNCDCHVSWVHKSDITKHIQTEKHGRAKKRKLTDESNAATTRPCNDGTGESGMGTSHSQGVGHENKPAKRQCSIGAMMSASQKRIN